MVYSRSKPTIFSLFLLSSLTASSTTFCSSSNACPKISSSCYTKEKKCCSPKTIMTPRSFVEDSTLSDALTFYEKYKSYYAENSHKKHSSTILNATPFYQVSTRGNKLASLFLPTCNSCVTVKVIAKIQIDLSSGGHVLKVKTNLLKIWKKFSAILADEVEII